MLRRVAAPPRAPRAPRSPRSTERPSLGPWLLLFAVAFLLRLGVAAGLERAAPGRPTEVEAIATQLAAGSGYAIERDGRALPTAATPPLAPWLASLPLRAFGPARLGPLLLQCAIGALIPLLLGSLSASMFGPSVGRVAAWIAAVSPVLALACGRLDTAVPYAATLLAALAAAASWVKTPRPARAFGLGALLGLATLAHAGAVAMPLVVAAWAWTPLGLTLAASDRARQVGLLGLGLLLVITPWAIRNVARLGAPAALSTSIGQRLLEGNHADVPAPDARAALDPRAGVAGEVARDRRAFAAATDFMTGHVAELPARSLRKVARLMGPAPNPLSDAGGARIAIGKRLLDGLLAVWTMILLPLALYGIGLALSGTRRWFQSLPVLVLAATTIVAAVFAPASPLKLTAETMSILFAAAGAEDLRRRIRTRGRTLRVIEGRTLRRGAA
jgi:hypothetical protein